MFSFVQIGNLMSNVCEISQNIYTINTTMGTLERAIEIATNAHRGQLDKAGNDYIGHPPCV